MDIQVSGEYHIGIYGILMAILNEFICSSECHCLIVRRLKKLRILPESTKDV